MREIKFRAWAFNDEFMVDESYEGDEFVFTMDNGKPKLLEAKLDQINQVVTGYGECNHEMLQYTGLKDKKGVEICEGDIIDCYWLAELGVCEIDCQHKGVVRFVDCRFEVSFSDKAFIRNIGEDGIYSATELELTCMSHDDDYAVEYEVIGNIYENPELIPK